MALQEQNFHNFTPAMYAAFAAKIEKDTGVKLNAPTDPPSKQVVTHGSFQFAYLYDAQQNFIIIQCLKKPLFIPASTIVSGIAEEMAELITATGAAPAPVPAPVAAEPVKE
jgi:hypothetical protein